MKYYDELIRFDREHLRKNGIPIDKSQTTALALKALSGGYKSVSDLINSFLNDIVDENSFCYSFAQNWCGENNVSLTDKETLLKVFIEDFVNSVPYCKDMAAIDEWDAVKNSLSYDYYYYFRHYVYNCDLDISRLIADEDYFNEEFHRYKSETDDKEFECEEICLQIAQELANTPVKDYGVIIWPTEQNIPSKDEETAIMDTDKARIDFMNEQKKIIQVICDNEGYSEADSYLMALEIMKEITPSENQELLSYLADYREIIPYEEREKRPTPKKKGQAR